MLKRKYVIIILTLLLLMIVGFGCSNEGSQSTENNYNETDKEEKAEINTETNSTENEEAEEEIINEHPHYEESRAELEKLTDDEIIELLNKSKDNKHQITEDFTEDEVLMLKTLTSDEYYDLMGMTDDEVLNWIDVYHDHININIIHAHQDGGVDSDKYDEEHRDIIQGLKSEFKWIRDNYKFEKEYHNDLMKEIVDLIDAHVDGDNHALFSLKYILHELNEEFNPESFDEERATHLTLSNAVRIQNGQDPINEHE